MCINVLAHLNCKHYSLKQTISHLRLSAGGRGLSSEASHDAPGRVSGVSAALTLADFCSWSGSVGLVLGGLDWVCVISTAGTRLTHGFAGLCWVLVVLVVGFVVVFWTDVTERQWSSSDSGLFSCCFWLFFMIIRSLREQVVFSAGLGSVRSL